MPRPASTDEPVPHVLVVDDDAMACRVVARLVRSAGYRVTATRSARQALDLLQSSDATIDLLLTDVIMPEMSGRDLAEAARALLPELPLLYISAFDGLADHAMPFGAPLLGKPFSRQELIDAVREAVGPARPAG